MGSSAKKKREKKRDFQKPKLKVGKIKPKPSNSTDTSFRSKAIVLNQQSLSIAAPSASNQFAHHISLLTSKSDSQRRDSLAYLTTLMASRPLESEIPQPGSTLLAKLYPLVLDGSNGVRTQVLRLFRSLPRAEIEDHVFESLPYVRAGMTHLATDIRIFSIEFLSWLLDAAGTEVVSCAGGWFKTLCCFLTILGWRTQESVKWSSNRAMFGKAGNEGKHLARSLVVLSEFLRVGIIPVVQSKINKSGGDLDFLFPLWQTRQHLLPQHSNAYGYLNLFGDPRDDETEMLEDREDRLRVFNQTFRSAIESGLEDARKEGGEVGRAAAMVTKVLKESSGGRELL